MATLTQGAMLTLPLLERPIAPEVNAASDSGCFDVLCFSHLRWDFVFQRPQHLLTRAAQSGRVFYWEEPFFEDTKKALLRERMSEDGVCVVQPVLPFNTADVDAVQRRMLVEFVKREQLQNAVSWFYTPMALAFANELSPAAIVYDCMDELSAFRGAPPELVERERALLRDADVVFVGGASLFAAKKERHGNMHLFPSSVDVAHFAQARESQAECEDQQSIPHPRVGFYGVLDERLDLELLAGVAELRPEMHLIVLGPIAKIREEELPKRSNLHFLGPKSYAELPRYLAGWDAAMLPFARNEATRFISPTKTPEYLAAWKQVVSTGIQDVISPYGEQGLVQIANDAASFAAALDVAVQPATAEWKADVDRMLARGSWDRTWAAMREEIAHVLVKRSGINNSVTSSANIKKEVR